MTAFLTMAKVLASATGLASEDVETTALQLRLAGLVPKGPVASDGAALLLLAVMTDQESLGLFFNMPLAGVHRSSLVGAGHWEIEELPREDLLSTRPTLGEQLAALVRLSEVGGMVPTEISVGGGVGLRSALVTLAPGAMWHGEPLTVDLRFAGECRRPDDAPLARLDRHCTMPGRIFEVLRDCLDNHEARGLIAAEMPVASSRLH